MARRRRNPLPSPRVWPWLVGGAVVLGVVAIASTARAALILPSGAGCHDNAFKWARDNLTKMTRWWNGSVYRGGAWVTGDSIGATTKSFAGVVFPGVPPAAFLGFMANGSLRGSIIENTTENDPRQGFHEIGPWGTEAGLRDRSAPAGGGDHDNWTPLATSSLVTRLLGRPATMVDDGWKSSFPDQAAVGLANLLRTGRAVNAGLQSAARATSENSLWFLVLAFMGWSAGVGGATSHINRVAPALAGVPDSQKWGMFLRAMRAAIQSGTISTSGGAHHSNPAYSLNRTWQKLAAGQLLASTVSGAGDPWWFDTGLGAEEAEYANYFCGKAS